MKSPRFPSKAFTLLEVVIVVIMVLVIGLALMRGIIFVKQAYQYSRERSNAQRIASSFVEQARSTPFEQLVPKAEEVTIDNNRTETDVSDDVTGQASLTLRSPIDPNVTVSTTTGLEYVIVEATVVWWTGGTARTAETQHRVFISTQFAP